MSASASASPPIPTTTKKSFTTLYEGGLTFDVKDSLPYYAPWLFVIAFCYGVSIQQTWLLTWLAFGFIPILDLIVPLERWNPTEAQRKQHEEAFHFKLPLYLWPLAQVFTVVFGAAVICGLTPYTVQGVWQMTGLAVSTAILTGGIGITVAHELFHKLNKWERLLGHILLLFVNYQHFILEHLSGHHKRVATPEDAASAKKGVTLFAFYPITLCGSWSSSWELESERLNKLGYSKWSLVWIVHNAMLWYAVLPLIVSLSLGTIMMMLSKQPNVKLVWWTVGFFYWQGWLAHMLLEIINYVEHYGLRRKEISPGNYEPVDITHSWNAPHRVTNILLFKLQRHSDHHAHALRRYHVLRTFEESPQLPTGYAGMAILSLFPPLWFSIMDPLVDMYNNATNKRSVHAVIPKQVRRQLELFTMATFIILSLFLMI